MGISFIKEVFRFHSPFFKIMFHFESTSPQIKPYK